VKDQHHSSFLPVCSSSLLQLELVGYAPAAETPDSLYIKDKLRHGTVEVDIRKSVGTRLNKSDCQQVVPPAGQLVSSKSSVCVMGDEKLFQCPLRFYPDEVSGEAAW